MRCPPCSFAPALLFFVFGGAAVSVGGSIRHDVADSSYRSLSNSYESVGRLNWTDAGSSYLASGTLIAPNWVLTAAHVVDGQAVSQMAFSVNQTRYTAVEWIPHPSWNGNLSNGYDIGLVRLSDSVDGVTPASRLTTPMERGNVGVSVGFGTTGTGQTGYSAASGGTKRAGENVIDAYGSAVGMSSHYLLSDFDDPNNLDHRNALGESSPLDLEYSIAPGDSGGGTFINVGSTPLLAGVHSFISSLFGAQGDGTLDASYSDFFGSTRVSLFNDWIDSYVLGGSSTALSLAAGDGVLVGNGARSTGSAAVPEPGAASLVAIGLLGLGLRKRQG